MPADDDPDYWCKIRDQFLLAPDKVFFNPATVGAMPKVVFERMLEHLRTVGTDWANQDDNREESISGYSNLLGIRTQVAGTHQRHGGGRGGWQLKAKRYGVVLGSHPPGEGIVCGSVPPRHLHRTRRRPDHRADTGGRAGHRLRRLCRLFSQVDGCSARGRLHVCKGRPDEGHLDHRGEFLGERLRTALRENAKFRLFSPTDEAMCAGITVYNVAGMTVAQLQDAFWTQARMRPRSRGDTFGVRHCTHIFNSPEEIDRAVEIVNGM